MAQPYRYCSKRSISNATPVLAKRNNLFSRIQITVTVAKDQLAMLHLCLPEETICFHEFNFKERTFVVQLPFCLLAPTWKFALSFNGPSFVIALRFLRTRGLFDIGGLCNRSVRRNSRVRWGRGIRYDLLPGRDILYDLSLHRRGRGVLYLLRA